MEWADHVEFLTDTISDDYVPPALAERPPLPEHLVFVWRAFQRLNGDRQFSQWGRGPIPFLSIDAYASRYGIDQIDDFERFSDLIRAMDRAFLNWKPPGSDDG